MKVEPGHPAIRVTRADVTRAARSVGIVEGDTVMVHSSLKSMGTVEGGPGAVIDGLLDAVGPGGTVAVPTLCNWKPEEKDTVFQRWDPKTSPSYVGALTEALRRRPDAFRSDHATHSVAAVGARAAELTARHGAAGPRLCPFGDKAFARESPWERLYQWNAAYCFIGVNFRVNTMLHYVETRLVERALERCPDADRPARRGEVAGWMTSGVWPSLSLEAREHAESVMTRQGIVRVGRLGAAAFRCARTRPMVDAWLALLEAEPARWFPPVYSYTDWLAAIQRSVDPAARKG